MWSNYLKIAVKTHELQNLAEKIADIKNAAAGIDLKFKVQVELGGESAPSNEVISRINEILQEIAENLELKATNFGGE